MTKKSKKAIFKFHANCGRMGDLEGVFISTKEKVDMLVSSEVMVYFGEVLGKHSEIYGSLGADAFTFVTDNEETVKVISDNDLTSGFNPFHYSVSEFDPEDYGLEGNGDEYYDDGGVDDVVEALIKVGWKPTEDVSDDQGGS